MNFLTAATGAVDLTNISILNAAIVAGLGYAVVFFGLILLMCVITILGKAFQAAEAKAKAAAAAAPAAAAPAAAPAVAPDVARGAAGDRERQSVESEIYAQAVQMLPQGAAPAAIVLAEESWHQGVVGIVASRIAEEYGCPTFLICLDGDRGKASSRSFSTPGKSRQGSI